MSDPRARVPTVSRRGLLAGALTLGATLATGCRQAPAPAADGLSYRQLVGDSPFVVGSRGGARDWPELTAYGFAQAAALPEVRALEIVVRSTADGVLVCCADPSTARVTGTDKTVARETWATLSLLRVRADQTKDPTQPDQPLARLEDVLEPFRDRFVLFVEPQGEGTASRVMARLIALQTPQRVVWKQPINSTRFGEAKRHGFATWGYALDEPAHTGANLHRLSRSPDIDLLGTSLTREPLARAVLDAAAQAQKPAIAWNVGSRVDAAKALREGFSGIASTAVREAVGWTG